MLPDLPDLPDRLVRHGIGGGVGAAGARRRHRGRLSTGVPCTGEQGTP
jgi:hypothetical protein